MSKIYDRITTHSQYEDGVEKGTQTHTTTVIQKSPPEPPFVKIYIEDLGRMKKLQGKTVQILLEFLRIMDYNNQVTISIGTKEEICERFEIYNESPKGKVLGINIIDQHIYKMIKAGILARKRKGQYIVNPTLFGRGQWANVKSVHLHIVYKEDGTIMYADVKKNKTT